MTSRFSRRQFLGCGMTLAGAGLLGSNTRAWARLGEVAARSEHVSAVVIGSGFGGSVAALRLGEVGIDTVVLERGRRWPIRPDGNTFATFEQPDGRAYWLRTQTGEAILGLPQLVKPIDRYVGVLEVVEADGMFIGAGAGVGGGSLVFNAIIVEPRRELFERVLPRQVDFDEMDGVYYPRVRRVLGSAPIPADVLATEYYRTSRVSLAQAQTAGFPTRIVDLAVDWDIVRQEIAGLKVPSAIAGQSFYGLNSGAKRSLDRSYLAQAEATGHVEVLPLREATAIGRDRGLYVVTTVRLRDDGSADGPPEQIRCTHLFLAAGSIGTTSLLVRARATGALHLSEHIGQHWAANGDIPVTRAGLPFTNAGTGGPAGHFILEDLENPFGPTSLVELVLPPHINAALGAAGAPPSFANYASLGIPPAIGFFTYNASTDAVHLSWAPPTDPRLASFLGAAQRTLSVLDQRNGSLTLGVNPLISAHPLGGAVLGKACDLDGRVKNHPGLYIVDGALIEGSTGLANPSFTIAASAERCMERLIPRLHDGPEVKQ